MTSITVQTESGKEGISAVRATLKAIHALRPEIASAVEAAQAALYTKGTLSARLRELVRLRIAFHNQCRTCMAVRYAPGEVAEGEVCSLERPAEAPGLSDAERAALDYADRFATDHLSIDEAVHDRLRQHFDEGEIVELGFLCAIFVGTGRLAASWKMVENLPESFRSAEGTVTPWGHDTVLSI